MEPEGLAGELAILQADPREGGGTGCFLSLGVVAVLQARPSSVTSEEGGFMFLLSGRWASQSDRRNVFGFQDKAFSVSKSGHNF